MSIIKNKYFKYSARKALSIVPSELREVIKSKFKLELKKEIKAELKEEIKAELKEEIKVELKEELNSEFQLRIKSYLHAEVKEKLKSELLNEVWNHIEDKVLKTFNLSSSIRRFCEFSENSKSDDLFSVALRSDELRLLVRSAAGLSTEFLDRVSISDLIAEFRFIHANAHILKPAFLALTSQRVLFCGQAYYNAWYLSRALRPLGWKADVYNWDENPTSQIYYHGEDFLLGKDVALNAEGVLNFYLSSLYAYDVFHFSNANGISFGWHLHKAVSEHFGEHDEIYLLKRLGKKIVYGNNGCFDGVSQTAFSKWGPESVCGICRWQNEPTVCSDERNLAWGKFRNSVADYQCLLGGNRVDYNDDPRVHEVPEFYCLDPEIWRPNIDIPEHYCLPPATGHLVRLYHAVGNRVERTRSDGSNIKSSHVYLSLIDRLRAEGLEIELIEPTGLPNKEVRFLQAQADIFLDMLTYGWFGANVREAMMLAKPVICYIRPEWLESLREEIPEYADELPIISATPQTVESVLRDLIAAPKKRQEIGIRSREFAVKWHSATAAGKRFDQIYRALQAGDPLLRQSAKRV